jgi:hypothetical protein
MPHLEQSDLRAAFDRLTPGLMTFAERHSLSIERYKRGFPIWEFSCRHPRGGAASVQLGLAKARDSGSVGATVQPHWWVDMHDERRRVAASFPALRLVSLNEVEIREALEHELAKVLASEGSALTRESRLVDPALTALRGREYGPPEIGKLSLPT